MNLSNEFLGELCAFTLTLLVFSYLIGDNPLYRIAIHAFLGVASAYVTIAAIQSVLWPRFEAMLTSVSTAPTTNDWLTAILLLIPWLLAVLILLRASSGLAPLGNVAIAFMVGVGSALAVGGAILGTLIPQVVASWSETGDFLKWGTSALGAVLVMLYFLYTGRSTPSGRGERPRLLMPITWAGQGFLTIALAALYAGTLAATVAIFVQQVGSLYNFLAGPDVKEILKLFGLG